MAVVARSTAASRLQTLQISEAVTHAEAARAALVPFAASRVLFFLITFTASWWIALFHLPQAAPLSHEGPVISRWFRWDTVWYLRVATDGYRTTAYANHHLNLAFFPLYPMLIHLWLQIVPWSQALVAMLIANLSFLAASYVLYRLVALDFGRAWALRVTWLLAFFPTSLFFFAGYSEGIFLLCLVLFFLQLRTGHWWQAGMWGAAATAARPMGIIVMLPFLLSWYQAHADQLAWLQRAGSVKEALRRWSRAHLWTLGAAAVVPSGLLAFMLYLWWRFGNPWAFSSSQRSWHRTLAWPWQTLQEAISRPLSGAPHLTPDQWHGVLDSAWALVFLLISLRAVRHLPATYAAFLWLFWLMTLCTPALLDGVSDPLISLPRFLLTAFPLLIYLAATPRRAWIAAGISLPLLIFNTLIFVSGGWVA